MGVDFNGTDEQLISCLEIIANRKSCPMRNAAIVLEAEDRLERAADKLARIEAVLASEAAVERVATVIEEALARHDVSVIGMEGTLDDARDAIAALVAMTAHE